MTDRDRLVELIHSALAKELIKNKIYGFPVVEGAIADHLIENGVIVSPCKVGDTVYYLGDRLLTSSVLPNTVYEAHVVRIVTNKLDTSLVIHIHNEFGVTEIPKISEFGKTVFLTREEAERELERRCEE